MCGTTPRKMEQGEPLPVWQLWRRLLQQVLLIPRLVRQGLRALRLAPSLASVVLPCLALAATGRRTRGAPLADQVPAVLPAQEP